MITQQHGKQWYQFAGLAISSSLWMRRLDVFRLLGIVAYGIALAISIFFGAGALPLKLHHAVVAGPSGWYASSRWP